MREGKWETWAWLSTFLSAPRPRCRNVENSRRARVFQGAVGRVENLRLVSQAFHRPGISTAPSRRTQNRGGTGDSILHARSSFSLARFIRWAHSVSLIVWACWSS